MAKMAKQTGADIDPRTVTGKASLLRELRQGQSLTIESAAAATDITALERVEQEAADGIEGPFTIRHRRRESLGWAPGLSKGTIARIERGEPVFPITLQIVAATYGVEYADVVDRDNGRNPDLLESGRERANVESYDRDQAIAALVDSIIELIQRIDPELLSRGAMVAAHHNGAAVGRPSRQAANWDESVSTGEQRPVG